VIDRSDWTRGIGPGSFAIGGQHVVLVGSSGVAVAIGAAVKVKVVAVKARRANSGAVYVGSSTVTNDESATTGGLQMDPGDLMMFAVDSLATFYVNGAAGDGVSIVWWT
jgi:hypothetical protein